MHVLNHTLLPSSVSIQIQYFRCRRNVLSSIYYNNHINRRFYRSVDLSLPHLWYDQARQIKRNIICHIGPTNSGKTFNALQQLKKSSNGLYLGPLRLLAWEVCENLKKEGIKCNLITGNERDVYKDGSATHTASTIEMADFMKVYDVAVIDEVQMIGDTERGKLTIYTH